VKILVADDDSTSRRLLEATLAKRGHEVVVTRDGQEAWQTLQTPNGPRLAILDWMMPVIDGVELCRRIRSGVLPGYVYVILLTSRSDKQDIVEGLSAGADDFVTKPFHAEELAVRVTAGQRILALESRHVAIFALAKLAESRDPETGQHLERVRGYCRLLAADMAADPAFRAQITPSYIETIYQTSPLHDIGKVGIPDCVLLKPGRLTDSEFALMKTHTEIGGATLSATMDQYPGMDYLAMARDVAWGHHERLDGSGYPRGLAGDAIPLSARIVALADVYDALTSKRVYKRALPHAIARSTILDAKGRQFDPRLVEAFLRHEEDFCRIRETWGTEGTGE
jgi:putative two-component system response regulator